MAAFLYYLPGHRGTTVTMDEIRAAGLEYAFDSPPTSRGVTGGPDGGNGVVCADARKIDESRIGFYAQRQTWRKLPTTLCPLPTAPWVGMDAEQKPGPEDLRREKRLQSYMLHLADGRPWAIAVAREPIETDGEAATGEALPRRMDLDDEGRFVPGEVVPAFAQLNAVAGAYFDAVLAAVEDNAGAIRFPFDDDAAVTVLQAQYKIDRVEIVMLGLLTFGGGEARDILNLAIDLPGWLDLKKKLAPATSATDAGPPADGPATGPV